jgi:hypothetical protein
MGLQFSWRSPEAADGADRIGARMPPDPEMVNNDVQIAR